MALPHPGSPEGEKNAYVLAATLHNNNSYSSSSNLALGLIQTHGIPIPFLRLPDWKMEILEESMITRDNSCIDEVNKMRIFHAVFQAVDLRVVLKSRNSL